MFIPVNPAIPVNFLFQMRNFYLNKFRKINYCRTIPFPQIFKMFENQLEFISL